MTLADLSAQYRECGESCRRRVAELELRLKNDASMSETEKLLLRRRITILSSMFRESLETSNYLARYYSKARRGVSGNGQGS